MDIAGDKADSIETSNESSESMPRAGSLSPTERARLYRQRLRAAGGEEVLFKLPRETIAFLDEIKECHGLRNRSQALLKLIEQGRRAAQKTTA